MVPLGNDWLRHSWNEGFKRYAMTVQVTITPNGRMSLPADIRKRLGLAGGGSLLVEETPDGVILRTVAQSIRSEEHTSELQSLMRISYAVFCLKTKINLTTYTSTDYNIP